GRSQGQGGNGGQPGQPGAPPAEQHRPGYAREREGGDGGPTWVRPGPGAEGDWLSVPLPVDPQGPLGRFPLLMRLEDEAVIFQPRAPAAAPPGEPAAPGLPAPPDVGAVLDDVRRAAFARLPWPQIQLHSNPPTVGLAGLPTYFWASGYGGEALEASASATIAADVGPEVPASVYPADGPRRRARALAVRALAWPAGYAWDWGDGTRGLSGSLGTPAPGPRPAPGGVAHRYARSSRGAPGGYRVTLAVRFRVAYEVAFDGDSARYDLGETALHYQRLYPVQQVQAVLVAREGQGTLAPATRP
ncbi:MAG TPA: hypothetical protein VHN78_03025, partial [Chloroflexota bacterium]|nr:hypothetical protein [Chloroflexota bacterium]